MRQIICVVIVALLVTACGARGPLYLPDKKYPQPQDASQPQAQPDTAPQPQDTRQ
jgi:predicted small lipoprotein YifL